MYFSSSVYLLYMTWKNIEYNKTKLFSKLSLDYISKKAHFSDLISDFPSIDNFKNQIKLKSDNYDNSQRKELVSLLKDQYNGINLKKVQKNNIDSLLNNNTFTITTGHQLNLLTGPLYFIYKIISVINLSESLNKKYKKYNFVPIYWMASEDHDFNEINNFSVQGKKFKWDSDQTGIVGDFKLIGIENTLNEFEKYIINSPYGSDLCAIVREAYENSNNLSDATRILVNKIFNDYGLVIIDPNNKKLKYLFREIIVNEIKDNVVKNYSQESIEKLNNLNYKIQASPRDINLFYIEKNIRERIIKKDKLFSTENNLKNWTLDEIINEINSSPEKFSPNVLLRPLYQEQILPNLCYVGGPAEIAYWLELKSVFNGLDLTFPILLNRNSAIIIKTKTREKLEKYNLKIDDIFLNKSDLKKKLIKGISDFNLDFSDLKVQLINQFNELRKISKKTEKSFTGALNAQEKKQINGLDKLEKRLIKAEQKIHDDQISKVIYLTNDIFPENKIQERTINFSSFYKDEGEKLIDIIKNKLDPMNQKFTIIEI